MWKKKRTIVEMTCQWCQMSVHFDEVRVIRSLAGTVLFRSQDGRVHQISGRKPYGKSRPVKLEPEIQETADELLDQLFAVENETPGDGIEEM
jgi:hypothetical protein